MPRASARAGAPLRTAVYSAVAWPTQQDSLPMSISAYRTFFADGFTHIGHIRI